MFPTYIFVRMSLSLCSSLQQRVKTANTSEQLKVRAINSSDADSHFQQLDSLRGVYEEFVKTGKELIPVAEKNLHDLNEEMDLKNQALDDVIFAAVYTGFNFLTLFAILCFSLFILF